MIKIFIFSFQAFIVRQSSQTNTLALTVSIEEIIEHYLIQPSKQCGDKLSLESSEHSFDNVLSLVHHYSTTKYVKIQSVLPTLKIWWPKIELMTTKMGQFYQNWQFLETCATFLPKMANYIYWSNLGIELVGNTDIHKKASILCSA